MNPTLLQLALNGDWGEVELRLSGLHVDEDVVEILALLESKRRAIEGGER